MKTIDISFEVSGIMSMTLEILDPEISEEEIVNGLDDYTYSFVNGMTEVTDIENKVVAKVVKSYTDDLRIDDIEIE